jgi:uncharacterized membrane protein HdeD (DUF308 family)
MQSGRQRAAALKGGGEYEPRRCPGKVQIPHEIVQYWGWFLAFGIGVLILGIAAVVRSVAATVVSMLFFGWLLVLASGIEIAQAVMVGHWAGFFHCSASPVCCW